MRIHRIYVVDDLHIQVCIIRSGLEFDVLFEYAMVGDIGLIKVCSGSEQLWKFGHEIYGQVSDLVRRLFQVQRALLAVAD